MSNLIELTVERAVAGGRMLARHDGVVVLVSGAIAGERVRARIEKRTKSMILAEVVEVLDASPSRRVPVSDARCGGMDYAHIDYAAQAPFKRDVIVDAFRRIGKIEVVVPVDVVASPEDGYRLRARLHVDGRRVGFFREGTHVLCDAAATRQLSAACMSAVDNVVTWLGARLSGVDEIVIAENVAATERVAHLVMRDEAGALRDMGDVPAGITGVTAWRRGRVQPVAGAPTLADTAADLFFGEAPVPPETTWHRHAASFFQGNRYLTGALVRHVLGAAIGRRVVDLYAGVGLFAVALAASGRQVLAVEGDPVSSADLLTNALAFPDAIEVARGSVEDEVGHIQPGMVDAVVCDPPRTGLSAEAAAQILALDAARIVYVSCDPATLVRDAAKAIAAGYELTSLRAFDLFPNTSHIESVAVLRRAGRTT